MIKSLSKMSPEIRDMISEIKYAPKQNSPNRILLYMQDDMQVVGNIKTIANKIKYYPQMSQSLSKDDSGNLKTQGYIDLSVVHHLYRIMKTVAEIQNPIKMFVKNHNKKLMQKMSYKAL